MRRTREVCACEAYPPGHETGMVVCWKCAQAVVRVVDDGIGPELVRSWCAHAAAHSSDELRDRAERLARAFHENYERLAPEFGYRTREASAKPWADVPDDNKRLMVATAEAVLREEGLLP